MQVIVYCSFCDVLNRYFVLYLSLDFGDAFGTGFRLRHIDLAINTRLNLPSQARPIALSKH